MATRTVRLDSESEKILQEITHSTGLSASAALKRGLRALRAEIAKEAPRPPYEIYEGLDLGTGGYASAPASQAKTAARRAIRRKHGR